jgi:hypothetical protein
MKTPLNVLIMVIAYWLAIYGVTLVPHMTNNYTVNLLWLTVVVPNVLRLIVGSIPQLAVDRLFFLASSLFALIIMYVFNLIMKDTKETIKEYGSDKGKTLKLSALLMTAFTVGALITYYSGIDNSIYSNMGWESNQGLTI